MSEQSRFMELLSKKEDLCDELARCISVQGQMTVIQHPLVYSVPHVPEMNALLNEQLRSKKERLKEAKDKEEWGTYLYLHERPYRFSAFQEIANCLKDEYWDTLSSIWTDSENLWQYHHILDDLLDGATPGRMTRAEDRQEFDNLPQTLRVYRGHQFCNKQGYSWSLSYWKAHWFAKRFARRGEKHAVSTGTIRKDQVIGLLLGRDEMEIVAKPNDIRNVTKWKPVKRLPYLDVVFEETLKQRSMQSNLHGPTHWEKVEYNGEVLAKNTPGADSLVVKLFAMTHDVKRLNDRSDPEHGSRAATMVKEMAQGVLKGLLSAEQLDKLMYACIHHDKGITSDDPTVGCCFDADRLDLTRVDIFPDPALLSTEYGKQHILNI